MTIKQLYYSDERSDGVPCGRKQCGFYNADTDDRCSGEAGGESAAAACADYVPDMTDTVKRLRDALHACEVALRSRPRNCNSVCQCDTCHALRKITALGGKDGKI